MKRITQMKRKTFLLLLIIISLLGITGCTQTVSKEGETSSSADTGTEKELIIASAHEDNFLQQVAERYMSANEDITVTIKNIDIGNSNDKYTQLVSTELMSGKGADMYDGRLLSYFKLADSGMLADLNELIGDELQSDDYYTGLLNSLTINGKRFTIPTSFNFSGYEINHEVAEKYNVTLPEGDIFLRDLRSISDQLPDDGSVILIGLGGGGATEINFATDLIEQRFNQFVNLEEKKSYFDSNEFYDVSKLITLLVDRKQIYTEEAVLNNTFDFEEEKDTLIQPLFLYNPAMCNDGTKDYKDIVHIVNDEGQTKFSSVSFMPIINNNSPNKELAADFVLFLLSEEVQSMPELLFCPLNKNAVRELSTMVYEDAKTGGWLPEGFDDTTLENNISIFAKLSESLTIFERQDRFIVSLIRDELSEIFLSKESLEQGAKNLQSSVNAYLNE